jgi:hypothetical protein
VVSLDGFIADVRDEWFAGRAEALKIDPAFEFVAPKAVEAVGLRE